MQLAITKNTIGSFIAKQLDKLLCYLYQNNIKKDTDPMATLLKCCCKKEKNQNISHLLSLLLSFYNDNKNLNIQLFGELITS